MTWEVVELGDVLTLKRGYDLPERVRENGSVPVVTSSGPSGYHNAAQARGPGVVTGRYGTLGEVYFIREDFWPHNTALYVKDFKGNNQKYVYYLLKSLNLGHHSAVSAVPGVNRNDLHRLKVKRAPIPAQQRIAAILGALDDKIELNRSMNGTLEEMAQALYKDWFVDFGPFQDGQFQFSEMGEIPSGWQVGNLGNIARNIAKGIAPAELDSKTPYIGLADMPKGRISLDSWSQGADATSNKWAFKKGQILFGKLRPYFKKVGVAPVDGICSTDILVVEAKTHEYYGLLLCQLIQDSFIAFTEAASSGTKMPRVSWGQMANYRMVLPPTNVAEVFSNVIRNWTAQIIHNCLESRVLAQARDYLLPKLLTGEINVRTVEEEESLVM
jgi:type I restriction enzyme, S subunit